MIDKHPWWLGPEKSSNNLLTHPYDYCASDATSLRKESLQFPGI